MKLTDDQVAKLLEEARARPEYTRTTLSGEPHEALRLVMKAGQFIVTSEGLWEFEADGEWILLPMPVWTRTLTRLRLAEPRLTGKGDGGPRRN